MRVASAIDWVQVSAPATPVAGRSMLYFLSDGLIRSMDSGGVVRTLVNDRDAQTVAGVKTFTSIPVFPNLTVTVAQLNATGTPSGSTYLRGDGTWSTVAAGTATNVVTSANATATRLTYVAAASPPATPGIGDLWAVPDANPSAAGFLPPIEPYVLSATGTLTVKVGTSRIPLLAGYTVASIQAAVNTAPTGASIIVDIKKNGTTLYTTQANRPTIAAGAFLSTATAPDVTTFVSGDYFTVDVSQVGSTVAGSDLTVNVRLQRTS